jgi:hypothetical protein
MHWFVPAADHIQHQADRLLVRWHHASQCQDLLGDPFTSERSSKDGLNVEYWSYMVEHRLLRRSSTFVCLTFVDGKVTEWVTDYGVGGHSLHRRLQ